MAPTTRSKAGAAPKKGNAGGRTTTAAAPKGSAGGRTAAAATTTTIKKGTVEGSKPKRTYTPAQQAGRDLFEKGARTR